MTTSLAIQVSLFKDSYQPFVALLQEGGIAFDERIPSLGAPLNSGFGIDIHTLEAPAFYSALATVICAFLRNRRSRKVIITTRENTVIHAEGLSQSDLERVIAQTKSMMAIETARDNPSDPAI
jgi:hypothetical protein